MYIVQDNRQDCITTPDRYRTRQEAVSVTFELNARLDLSWQATTKSLCPLQMELLLQVLSKSTRTMMVRVICGDEGVGDIPGVQGDSGESVDSAQCNSIDTRTQT